MIEVTTQAELDAAIDAHPDEFIVVRGGAFRVSRGRVEAYGSATVRAYGSATVRAYDSATVRAYDSATVRAGRLVAVHNHNPDGRVKVTGGVVINVRPAANLTEWLDGYGVEPDDDGVVTLYKAVDDGYESSRGFRYQPGSTPVAPDWDGGVAECGGGLHFCAAPWIAKHRFKRDATRFVACPIRVEDSAYHPDGSIPEKVKARGCCAPVWECDIDGERLEVPT